MKCPACDGRRWVDSKHKGPSVCPICNGTGKHDEDAKPKEKRYDQDAIWTALANSPPAGFDTELSSALKVTDTQEVKDCTGPYSFIVHLMFDKNVTPSGSLIFDQVRRGMLRTGQHSQKLSSDHLVARGYVVLSDGAVQVVNDIPVGPFYNVLHTWGVNRYSNWDMEKPITIDVNRKGNPFFMDNNMVAFGATYVHGEEGLSGIRKSLEALNRYCSDGIDGSRPIGRIIKLHLAFSAQGI